MDSNIIINKCERRDLEELSQFAYKINGMVKCASTFCPNTPEGILKDLDDSISLDNSFECRNGNQLIGIINCYVDHEKRNTDCSLLIAPETCYEDIAIRLFDTIRKQLNPHMKYTFFFPKENTNCSNFLKKIGACPEINEYSLLLKRGNMKKQSQSFDIIHLPKEHYKQFMELHDSIFPGVYISGKDIINDVGNKHFVYVMINNQKIVAYSVLKLRNGKRGTAEIVAVSEGFRNKGYGRAVLAFLVSNAFENWGMEYIDLIVDGDNENAIHLYLDMGFVVESENCCYTVNG